MAIQKFEDLIAWQKARVLSSVVYTLTREEAFSRDYDLIRQIRKAAVSVMSNIAEGFERRNPNEFSYFLRVAKASCAEVRSQSYISFDIGYITDVQLSELLLQTDEVSKIISGLSKSLRTS